MDVCTEEGASQRESRISLCYLAAGILILIPILGGRVTYLAAGILNTNTANQENGLGE